MQSLIDKAIQVCGSSVALAKRLDVAPNVVSMLKTTGRFSPGLAAELAAMVGEEAGIAAVEAVIARSVGKRREVIIHKILGDWLELHKQNSKQLKIDF